MKDKCLFAGKCGGCPWFDLEYAAQLEQKKQKINQTLESDIEVIPCPELFYYRNRMDFAFGPNGEFGLKETGHWDQVVDLDQCYLLSEQASEVMQHIRSWAKDSGLSGWDQRKGKGMLRHCVIREGKNTNERMVMIITSQGLDDKHVDSLRNVLSDLCTSIVLGINNEKSDVSRAGTIIPVHGNPWLEETINGYRYRIHPNSFFQTNSVMAAKLQDTVKEFCGDLKDKTLLDLFCGSGFFSVAFANDCKRTVGIELDPSGIENARTNAELNNIANVEYHVSEAEKFDWAGIKPNVVIVDPPRSGTHYKVLDTLRSALPDRIVYISCNYERFAKELPALTRHYKISKMQALDLFPHTPHVELVTLFEKI